MVVVTLSSLQLLPMNEDDFDRLLCYLKNLKTKHVTTYDIEISYKTNWILFHILYVCIYVLQFTLIELIKAVAFWRIISIGLICLTVSGVL